MYPHGDEIISGVDPKVIPDRPSSYNGPRCGYTERTVKDGVTTTKSCSREDVIWNVTGHGRYGYEKKTPVCGEHLEKAWKEWKVESAEKINPK